MKFHPKVSIVIPVYNGSNYLAEAIDSALAQTYDNIEIIVVNDGSKDNGATEQVAKSYGDKIRYFAKENGGVATALNFGIEKMTGEYFSWLSHDDMYEKQKISEQVKYLDSLNDKHTIIACNVKTLFPNGIKKNEYIDKNTFEFIDIFLATSAVVGVNGCALLIPKKAFGECGNFDLNLPVTQDYDLWFRLAKKFKFSLLEKNLVISRRHDGQDSVQKQKLCFEAGEKLHYEFLNDIDNARFDKFFDANPSNLEVFIQNYSVYKENNYIQTASMMLKQILRYYYMHDKTKFNALAKTEIGIISGKNTSTKTNNKKKILIYTNVWHKGGIERVLTVLLEHIAENYDCILAVKNEVSDTGFAIPANVTLVRINNSEVAGMMNILAFFEIDLLIGNPNISEKFLQTYQFIKNTNVKTIAYNHGYYFLPYMYGEYLYPIALQRKDAYASADYVVWLTEIACNLYSIENSNGYYIPNPAPPRISSNRVEPPTKKILAVGRFDDDIKQIDKTLLVFKEIYALDSEYSLDVVGYCPMDLRLAGQGDVTLESFIINANIPLKNIRFLGEQAEINTYYDQAGFLLSTSKCEGFGMVFLEAFARGLPCASFEYLGVDEIIKDGINGVSALMDDYQGLAKKIIASFNDKKVYKELSKEAIETANQYSIQNYYHRWDVLLDAVFNDNVTEISDIKPEKKLTATTYNNVIIEYEKLLKEVINQYYAKEFIEEIEPPKPSKVSSIKTRFKESLARDGVALTAEKVVRKAYKKTIGRK